MGPLKGIRSEAHEMEKVCLAGDAGALRSQLLRGSSPCNQLAFPLHAACYASSFECVQLLLEYQADVNLQDNDGARPLSLACEAGCLPIVQLLCSYGARRQHVREIAGGLFAEEAASEHPHVVQWLKASRDWVTPLHHVQALSENRALELLRGGADVHARRRYSAHAPSPLELARQRPDGGAARLVLQASLPWSPATHQLFPRAARLRATALYRIGLQLARAYARDGCALLDVWITIIMPAEIRRDYVAPRLLTYLPLSAAYCARLLSR